MRFRLLTFALINVALHAPWSSFAQHAYPLDHTTVVHRLDSHVQFLVDSTDELSMDDILRAEQQALFKPHYGNLTFGYLKSSIWLKLRFHAASLQSQWYLEIPAPFLEYVDFYQSQQNGKWHHTTSGYYRKHNERSFSHTGHVVPLHFDENSLSTVYVKIAGTSPKTFPLYAIEKEEFGQRTRLEDLGYGIFFGILAVMFFYNIFFFLTLRQISYLLYSCIIACTFLIFAAISGYGGMFLWPETPGLNYVMGKLLLEVLIIFMTLYTLNFLQVKKYSLPMYYVLLALIPLSLIALLLAATNTLHSAGNNLITLSTLVFISAGIVVSVKGNKAANYFIAAWLIYLLGGLFLTLRNSGILDYNFWTTHFVEIGAVLGTMMIGFAIGAQYRRFKKEKEEAQALALKIQQEATGRMELMVDERTGQLHRANKELQRTLETNRKQTEIIEYKNAELDTFFQHISHDLKGPISASLALMILAKLDVKDNLALEYIDKQHLQLERLNQIVTGLVDLTRLNKEELNKEKIDFDRMIDGCISASNAVAHFSKLTFEKDVQPNLAFYCEWTLLNTILQNLIENAIKYSRDSSPYVRIKVRKESEWVVIQVQDNGKGIPAEHQTKIFEMFYRATREGSGSGLGLYVLKRSLERLNGTIEIESEVGVGSTFIVRLPLVSVPEAIPINED